MSDLSSGSSTSGSVGGPAPPISVCGRSAPRKPVSGRARVAVEGGAVRSGKVVDISESGIGILLDDPIASHKVCMLQCEFLHDGKRMSFNTRAVAAYSVLAGTKGFRIGLQFSAPDAATMKVIHDLMQ